MDRNKLALAKKNYIILIAGILAVIIGFLLMSGPGSTPEQFNPDIFSWRRIRLAPIVCLLGFITIGYGIICPAKDKQTTTENKEIGE